MGQKITSSKRRPLYVVLGGGDNLEREGIKALLSGRANIKVLGHAKSFEETIGIARDTGSGIIVLCNISELFANNVEKISLISSHIKFLAMITPKEHIYIQKLLITGVRGFISKGCTVADLIESIRILSEGKIVIDSTLSAELFLVEQKENDNTSVSETHVNECISLSEREKEVLDLLKVGYKNKEIARKLFISVRTVEMHLQKIYSKLNVHSRMEATFKSKYIK